jgi:hypothetical protein
MDGCYNMYPIRSLDLQKKICDSYSNHISIKEILIEFKISRSTLYKILKVNNIPLILGKITAGTKLPADLIAKRMFARKTPPPIMYGADNPSWKGGLTKDPKYILNWRKKKKIEDPAFLLGLNCRTMVYNRLKRYKSKKYARTFDLIGCSPQELKQYLESKFYPDKNTGECMTWDNYGMYGWHIDHIKPVSRFTDLASPEQQKECFNYRNLQPLWWWENLSKGTH